jgi:phytoene dehydrogenase-like protein
MTIIVGAGLSGLACAIALARAGRPFVVLEAAARPGGRQKTTVRDGYVLDHGFQVVLDSYPAVEKVVDVAALQPRYFEQGAIIHDEGRSWHLSSPLSGVRAAVRALGTGCFTAGDKVRLALLGLRLLATRESALEALAAADDDVSTADFLVRRGFSTLFAERFARPFFGGVFLDDTLSTSAGIFLLQLRRFLTGRAWVPAGGIAALPHRMASFLPPGSLKTGCPVVAVESSADSASVVLGDGTRIRGDHVVAALDEPSLRALLGLPRPAEWRKTTTVYFKTSRPLHHGRCIVLPAGRERLVRHFVQLSNIAPETAPPGMHLVSATIIDDGGMPDEAVAARAAAEIGTVFPACTGQLGHLETIHVEYALPVQPPSFAARRKFENLPPRVLAAGDWDHGASIQSAITSGLAAAEEITR